MKFIVNGKEKEITMRIWTGSEYTPDFFGDIDTDHRDGDILTEAEYSELVGWWENEIENYNIGDFTDALGVRYHPVWNEDDTYAGHDIDSGEIVLFAD